MNLIGFTFWPHTVCSLWFCFSFSGVFVLTQVINWFRTIPLTFKDQFIIAYGGLRGAICFALVFLLPAAVFPRKKLFITAAIVVIFFTVFILVSKFLCPGRVSLVTERRDQIFQALIMNSFSQDTKWQRSFGSYDVRENALSSCHLIVQGPRRIQFIRLVSMQGFLFKETQLSDLSLLLETDELSLLILVICLTL